MVYLTRRYSSPPPPLLHKHSGANMTHKTTKYRVRVFVDEHPEDKPTDDMSVRSELDAKTLKILIKEWLGDCLSFQKMSKDNVIS